MNKLEKYKRVCEIYENGDDIPDIGVIIERADQVIDELIESIPKLVELAAEDGRTGHFPSIYLRGLEWRYHLDIAKNVWHDADNPVDAANGVR